MTRVGHAGSTNVMILTLLVVQLSLAAPVPKGKPPILYHPVAVGTKWVMKSGNTETPYVISRVTEKNGEYVVSVGIGSGVGSASTHVTEHVSAAGVYREFKDFGDVEPPLALVKAPLRAGDSWEYGLKFGGVKDKWVRTVAGEEAVKVPAGEFQAMRIDWVYYVNEKNVGSGTDWYAVDIGLVKRVAEGDSKELVSFTPAEPDKKSK